MYFQVKNTLKNNRYYNIKHYPSDKHYQSEDRYRYIIYHLKKKISGET